MILVAILLFIITTFLFYKEPFDKTSIVVDPNKNSIQLPNKVMGMESDDIHFQAGISLKENSAIELGREIPEKGDDSGKIRYNNDKNELQIMGAGKKGDKSKISLWDNVSVGSLLHVGDQLTLAGPLQLDKGIINYNDTLELIGKGKVKMGQVETGDIAGKDITGKSITGESITGESITSNKTMTTNSMTTNSMTVNGPAFYKGNVNISPTELNGLALSFGTDVGFKKNGSGLSFSSGSNIGGFDETSFYLNNQKPLEFGKGSPDPGKISYTGNSLEVVGAGTSKKITLLGDVEINGTLNGKKLSEKELSGITIKSENKVYTLNDNGKDIFMFDANTGKYALYENQMITQNSLQSIQDDPNVKSMIKKLGNINDLAENSDSINSAIRSSDNGITVSGTDVNGTTVNGTDVNGTTVNGKNINGTIVNAMDSLTIGSGDKKWDIFVDDEGELRFSKQGVKRKSLKNRGESDGISITEGGDIWTSHPNNKGWLSNAIQKSNKLYEQIASEKTKAEAQAAEEAAAQARAQARAQAERQAAAQAERQRIAQAEAQAAAKAAEEERARKAQEASAKLAAEISEMARRASSQRIRFR